MASRDPLISVVVPVRNGRAELRSFLQAIGSQTLPRDRFEVIVGDDGSTDGSTDGLDVDGGWLRVVRGPAQNSYVARNRAVQTSSAAILAFSDCDCRPSPTWLADGLAALEKADVVGGKVRFEIPSQPTIWTLLNVDMFLDQERAIRRGRGLGGNLFVRRADFDDVGGFDDSLPSGGDGDFVERCLAAGKHVAYADNAVTSHFTRDDAASFLLRIWRQSRSLATRGTRDGRRASALRLRWWTPLIPTYRARRRLGSNLLFDRRKLAEYGLTPRRRDYVAAFVLIYFVIPYVSGVAQLVGWWCARRGDVNPRLSSIPSVPRPPKKQVRSERDRANSAT